MTQVKHEVLVQTIRHYERLFEKLDEAMASEELIQQHTKDVGGFVSRLNLTATEDEIVEEACEIIRKKNKKDRKENE